MARGGMGLAVGMAVVTLAGCRSTTVSSAPLATSGANGQPTAAPTTSIPVAHVGSTVRVSSGSKSANVTVSKLIDPATGASEFSNPDSGKRFVAVGLTVTASSTVEGDANIDVTLIGSDNQTYTADFDAVQGCTDFDHGSFTLSTGESATGCVNFQVPTGVFVTKVRFAPDGGMVPGSVIGEWVNP